EKDKLVMRVSEGQEFRGVGGLCRRLVHPTINNSKHVGVTICFVNPGEELPFHSHDNEEAYFVLQGTGLMRLGSYDEDIQLEPWLSVFMPGGEPHYTKNTGNEPLVLLCSLAPPPVAMDK
ncbi:MAG: cupin domain-containing protein, partial [Eubacteriales bacterium]|nr:cupin domain-containing protein [Eubacteriales bacterium]